MSPRIPAKRPSLTEIQKHIAVLNDDYTKMAERIAKIEADLVWVKWFVTAIGLGVGVELIKDLFFR